MHELSLAENVLELIEDAARSDGFHRVRRIVLEIGELAAVEPEAMRFCFEAVVRDTLADDAVLDIVQTPGRGWCDVCRADVSVPDVVAACPQCGSFGVRVTGGRELRLKSLDVE